MKGIVKTSQIEEEKLVYERFFTKKGVKPFDMIKWELRDARISDSSGKTVFEQKNVEIPTTWTQTATNIAISKYFRGQLGTDSRETSVKQMVYRVAHTIVTWGREGDYFSSEEEAQIFEDELTYILVSQYAAFNSPVWFNLGVDSHPQSSACFINSIRDDMRSILEACVTEGMIFKGGSGSGINFSTLRSSKENLKYSSGKASGPVSFMKGLDTFAGVIKSGGKTRRAAKMCILNVTHPDILEFINCKAVEEKKAWALIDAGYDASFTGDAYGSIQFQNANHSVRVTDEFMKAFENDGTYETKMVTTGATCETLKASDVMKSIAESAYLCGDPGVQFDDIINDWHPCSNSARINASNPCVTGDTKVLTEDGKWIRIDSLLGVETKIITNTGILMNSSINGSFETGIKPVYKLTTQNGYELKLTGDHKVYTVNRGFVQAAELSKDDLLLLPQTQVAELKEVENPEFYQLMGLYLGDGCKNREGICLTMSSTEEIEVLQKICTYTSGLQRITHVNFPAQVHLTSTSGKLNIGNRNLVSQISEYINLDLYSHEKKFGDKLFALTLSEQKYVLQGLFTSDGTVGNYGEKSQYVSLDSSSLQLLKDTQLMLLGFGVKSKLYLNRRAGKNTALLPDGKGGVKEYSVKEMYSLRISRESRITFEKLIGFMPESKKALQLKEMNEQVGTYAESPYETVKSLEYLGEEKVYDLTEPVTHTFIANGITIHNCSEYMFLDDTACNLASINLMKCRDSEGNFDVETYKHIIKVIISAQEILVSNSSYPTDSITQNSFDFRPLGIGYANLGALLMSRGLPYDSDEGRNFAGALTSILSGYAYAISSLIAKKLGSFKHYEFNKEPFLKVISQHRDAAYKLPPLSVPEDVYEEAQKCWDQALANGEKWGYKNAQISVLAPTGTIGFLMDCDTTGVEPDIALVKYKWLVGGGMIKIVNNTVPEALKNLKYNEEERKAIIGYLEEHDTIEGAPYLKNEHLPVFDCAFKPAKGKRSIHYLGHLRMMGAVQPFISGAISKTVNMPNEVTAKDIMDTYDYAWKLGIKAVAIYRDGCKRSQPLTTSLKKDEKKGETQVMEMKVPLAQRKRMPADRQSLTHKFEVGGMEGYLIVGLYEDGSPGELFLEVSRQGSTLNGFMDSFATSVSIALQYGVPLKVLVRKFMHSKFEPAGITKNKQIRFASSILDYVSRYLAFKFLKTEELQELGLYDGTKQETLKPLVNSNGDSLLNKELQKEDATKVSSQTGLAEITDTIQAQSDAPMCTTCGNMMVRSAACYKCFNCGSSSGCS